MHAETGGALLCPGCRYDLMSVAGDAGRCPECGLGFVKAGISRRAARWMRVGMGMIAAGLVGVLLARGVGACLANMPVAENGGHGDPEAAAAALGLLPLWLVIAGLGMVCAPRAGSAAGRYWPAGLAAALGFSMLHRLVQDQAGLYGMPNYPAWAQLYGFREFNISAGPVLAGLFIFAVGTALGRASGRTLGRWSRAAGWAGLASIPMSVGGSLLSSHMSALAQASAVARRPAKESFFVSWMMAYNLTFVAQFVLLGAMVAVAVLALAAWLGRVEEG